MLQRHADYIQANHHGNNDVPIHVKAHVMNTLPPFAVTLIGNTLGLPLEEKKEDVINKSSLISFVFVFVVIVVFLFLFFAGGFVK